MMNLFSCLMISFFPLDCYQSLFLSYNLHSQPFRSFRNPVYQFDKSIRLTNSPFVLKKPFSNSSLLLAQISVNRLIEKEL